jgi:hypothetical protein
MRRVSVPERTRARAYARVLGNRAGRPEPRVFPIPVPPAARSPSPLLLPIAPALLRRIFGKNASSSRSVCLEDHKGTVLLHLEFVSEAERELVAKGIAGACKAPLRR